MTNLLQKLKLYEGHPGVCSGENKWHSHPQGKTLVSINPATGKALGSVQVAHANDYEALLKDAGQSFLTWREMPAPSRGLIIRDIAELLRIEKESLGNLISLEMGKSQQEGLGEIQEMIDIADFAVGQSRMLYGKTMPSERTKHRLFEQWQPLGITGVITSFNFPVAVWAWNAFIAAICGNTVIWKPSSQTPLSAIAIQHLCNQVLAQHQLFGIFNLLIASDHDVASQMLDDPRIPLISFTGSTHTGRQISQRVASRLGRTILELGGNNAIIVDQRADLNLAVPAIVFGAMGTSGQRCTSARRLIIHESIYSELMQRLLPAYQQITIGDPIEPKNLMGPLISQQAVDKYLGAIEKAKALGGEVLFGGKILKQPGFFVEPCLIRAKNDWDIVQEETFAPILYVMTYQKIEEAIAMQNAVRQGLSSAIFTNDMRHMELFLSAQGSDCGLANVNMGTSGAEIGGAFGGEKETGGGRESGSDSWKAYMRRQTVTINWGSQLPLAQGIHFDLG